MTEQWGRELWLACAICAYAEIIWDLSNRLRKLNGKIAADLTAMQRICDPLIVSWEVTAPPRSLLARPSTV